MLYPAGGLGGRLGAFPLYVRCTSCSYFLFTEKREDGKLFFLSGLFTQNITLQKVCVWNELVAEMLKCFLANLAFPLSEDRVVMEVLPITNQNTQLIVV